MALYIGLMSGTSLDGCDAALVETEGSATRLICFDTLPMPSALREKILCCCDPDKSDVRLVCSLNFELGMFFARAVKALCQQANIPAARIAAIGSHGQTVYHIPVNDPPYRASTLQLGEPAVIAYETGITVVSSFRAMDMAAGGKGAPLVPYPEYLLYRAPFGRALQNLGGIGNVTVLPANCRLNDVLAFDTGPANMVIDALCQKLLGLPYDEGGRLAAQGTVNKTLLDEWMAMPFLSAAPPKATGRELFGEQLVRSSLKAHPGIRPLDWIATATRFTADSIILNYRRFVFPYAPIREIVLAGGGSHNNTLRGWLASAFAPVRVVTQEDLGWNSDAKEAIAFALLARETLEGRCGNVPSATGASRRVVLGNITPGFIPSQD